MKLRRQERIPETKVQNSSKGKSHLNIKFIYLVYLIIYFTRSVDYIKYIFQIFRIIAILNNQKMKIVRLKINIQM